MVLFKASQQKVSRIVLGAKTALKAKEGFEFHNITSLFFPTQKGNYRLLFENYMYWCARPNLENNTIRRWSCSRLRRNKCPAVAVVRDTELIPTTKGNYVLRVGHYMYSSNWNRPKDSQDSRRWYCSQRKKYSCQTNDNLLLNNITNKINAATAIRPSTPNLPSKMNIGWSQKGQMRLSCAGYTFVLPNHYRRSICKRWYCSTDRPKGCKAFVITKYEEIISINNSHNHPARTPRTILTDENDAISTFMNTNTVSANIITNQMGRQRLVLNVYFTKSQRGNKLIYINGYTYYLYRVTGPRERWKCTNHRCYAFLLIIDGQVMKFVSSHTHRVSEFVNRGPMWRANLEWNV
ncbi:hypothetical protein MSG28_008203 [Choristoneura fumiferana]|uniref:Uncharacterized protein n=1 Tax=Choristoneura fumiferana TaxID=7141 RepID=A0ACC0JAQ4_CHOFU|nr:hypothetical protein MSG28_008203 [Choristoneura fumiferana]